MSRVFLSHSSRDSRQAVAVKAWLIEHEPGSGRGDFPGPPTQAFGPGERWNGPLNQASARCEAVGLAQSAVSKHLACLRDCGLVASDPVGRASLFRLTQPALAELLGCAETVLAATGNAVALCLTYGMDTRGSAETP